MIDEKRLAAMRSEVENSGSVTALVVTIPEMLSTMETLWKIARAARRWQGASIGTPSVDAEYELSKLLEQILKQPATES